MTQGTVFLNAATSMRSSLLREELRGIIDALAGMLPTRGEFWGTLVGTVILAAFCGLLWLIVHKVVLRLILAGVRKTRGTWDDHMVAAGVFDVASHLPSALVFAVGVLIVPSITPGAGVFLSRFVFGLIALDVARLVSSVLNGVNAIYNDSSKRAAQRPIKSYIQIAQVLTYFTGIICMISVWLGKSPVLFLSGIGAMSAVLMLVFRDTLLSLVAGVQLTSNGLIQVGDWIEMPSFEADGDVTDIALNTVTVRNWDNTSTLIPTHKFLEHSFKNWRHVFDSKARRIKRHILIDAASVRFLTDDEIEKLCGIHLLRPYLEARREEVASYNRALEEDGKEASAVNRRALTNLGTFRAYAGAYLNAHPELHKGRTTMVRQLQPTNEGIPLEIYTFVANPAWVHYEGVQADIFDHFFSILHEFGLRQYQAPGGADLRGLRAEPPTLLEAD